MRRLTATMTAALFAFSLTGCGGGEDEPESQGPESTSTNSDAPSEAADAPDTEGALDLVRKWTQAVADGDGKEACSYQTDAFTEEMVAEFVHEGFASSGTPCEAVVKSAGEMMEAFGVGGKATVTLVSAEGNQATVKAVAEGSADEPDAYVLEYADGRWLIAGDAKDDLAKANAARWVENWCKLQPGQTKAAAIALMGEPTQEYGVADADPQIGWEQGPYSFTAFLDTDDNVRSFYADYDSLGQSDLAKMPCQKTRGR